MSVHACLCFNLGLAHRKVSRAFEEALAPLNLTVPQAHFLSCLFAKDALLSRDLARQLGVDPGTLTPMIDRMERMGLIRRCPHPGDRRASRLCLEPAAWKLKPEIEASFREANERLMSKLSPEDYQQLLGVVQRLAEEVGEPVGVESAAP